MLKLTKEEIDACLTKLNGGDLLQALLRHPPLAPLGRRTTPPRQHPPLRLGPHPHVLRAAQRHACCKLYRSTASIRNVNW